MPKPFLSILLFISVFLLWGCAKEEIYSNALFGNWAFNQVQLLGNQKDSIIAISGQFEFRKGTEIGQSGFGALAEATADVPYWSQTGLTVQNKIIYIGKPIEPANYNFKNVFNGYYADKVSGNSYLSIPLEMTMPDKNTLHIILGNENALTNEKFPDFFIRLNRK